MKTFKTKLALLLTCLSLMVPSAASAATKNADASTYIFKDGISRTNVHGIHVPANYIRVHKDARVAYIPEGVGLAVIDISTPLPKGAYYLMKVGDQLVPFE